MLGAAAATGLFSWLIPAPAKVRPVGSAEMPVTAQESVGFIGACPQTAQPVAREIEP
jgi:hypothetical protein